MQLTYLSGEFDSFILDWCNFFVLFTQWSLRPDDNFVLLFIVLSVVAVFFFLSSTSVRVLLSTVKFSFVLFFSWKKTTQHKSPSVVTKS